MKMNFKRSYFCFIKRLNVEKMWHFEMQNKLPTHSQFHNVIVLGMNKTQCKQRCYLQMENRCMLRSAFDEAFFVYALSNY